MAILASSLFRLVCALAIGCLIGAERERRKGEGPLRSPAGIRTFALASLMGGVSIVLGGKLLLAVTAVIFAIFSAVAYRRSYLRDPGLTSEAALVLTVLLGGLAQTEAATASALAVIVTVLLAARLQIHRFISHAMSESEMADTLIFAAATLVVLPLMPDRYIGPFSAIDLRTIWKIVVLIMSISATGYIAVRWLGPRFGLPIVGLVSGFVSSTATIGTMGTRARQDPALAKSAVAGAVLSTVATILQLAAVLAVTSEATLHQLRVPLLVAGVAAIGYGVLIVGLSIRKNAAAPSPQRGRMFSLWAALLFAALVAGVLLFSAALQAWLGKAGVLTAAAIAGFADAHAAAVSVASLVSAGKMTAKEAVLPVLAGLTTNTISKIVLAFSSGGRRYAIQIGLGLFIVLAAAWATVLLV